MKPLQIIDAATAAGHVLSDVDRGFVEAYRSGAASWTPDETTSAYSHAELEIAVEEIVAAS